VERADTIYPSNIRWPARVGDGYGSGKSKRRGLNLHRRGRTKALFNDDRSLRRYRKRWKIERTFTWLGNYRRLTVRYENHLQIYQALFHLACLLITLRYL
jgi:IS4 transposase